MTNQISTTWSDKIINPFLRDDRAMIELRKKIKIERSKYNVLPEASKTFEAFNLCPYEKVKVVIVGQDPYPDKKHANGLGFSSNSSERPASLQNIFEEIHESLYSNLHFDECFKSNDLTPWAEQGVLLINANMSVVEGKPGSHRSLGWDKFLEHIMKILDKHENNPVFLLLGQDAQELSKHLSSYPETVYYITSHPSPKSVNGGFSGCGFFKEINRELSKRYFKEVIEKCTDAISTERMAHIMKEFLDKKGHDGHTIKSLKFFFQNHMADMPYLMTEHDSNLRKEFEINWKTY